APKAGALPGCATPRSNTGPHPDRRPNYGRCGTTLPHQCGVRYQAAPRPDNVRLQTDWRSTTLFTDVPHS
ncbi:MAG: hypothetical protein V3W10_03210, partial [candidate division NC10 bacterium]